MDNSGVESLKKECEAAKKIAKEYFSESEKLKAIIREQQGKNLTPTVEGLSSRRLGLLTFVISFIERTRVKCHAENTILLFYRLGKNIVHNHNY